MRKAISSCEPHPSGVSPQPIHPSDITSGPLDEAISIEEDDVGHEPITGEDALEGVGLGYMTLCIKQHASSNSRHNMYV